MAPGQLYYRSLGFNFCPLTNMKTKEDKRSQMVKKARVLKMDTAELLLLACSST